mgnify:CR=1 FL=1
MKPTPGSPRSHDRAYRWEVSDDERRAIGVLQLLGEELPRVFEFMPDERYMGYYGTWWIDKEKGHTLRITTTSSEGVNVCPKTNLSPISR